MEDTLPNNRENRGAFAGIITADPQMTGIFRYVESIAGTAQPVLITGETGVGKELIARSIHALSGRKGRFVAVNVAGVEDQVFNDTLFGHVRGAFTDADSPRRGLIEAAAGGTLFLDEIGDLSFTSQAKLLRLLQEAEYYPLGSDRIKRSDARIEAATNRDLWQLQRDGKFRRDLNFRIRTHHVHVPPLRERSGDIPLLLDHFLERAAAELGRVKPSCPAALVRDLEGYAFPGNVRELGTMVYDALCRNPADTLAPGTFRDRVHRRAATPSAPPSEAAAPQAGDAPQAVFPGQLPTLKEVTELLVREAMRRTDGNQTAAARLLGVSQPALSKRLKKMGSRG